MLTELIIAGAVVVAVAARPRSWRFAGLAAAIAAAGLSVEGTASVGPALSAIWPMLAFLTGAVAATGFAVRLGLARWTAGRLASWANGRGARLYTLACGLTALLTAAVSLDGAVVLMAPVVAELRARGLAWSRSLLVGVVAVANAFSVALPEGNPTNLVVMRRLGLGPWQTALHLLPAGIAAAVLSALLVGIAGRGEAAVRRASPPASPARGLASVARVGLQVLSLLVAVLPLARAHAFAAGGLSSVLAVAGAVSLLAATASNLPASAVVAATVAPGPAAYAALIGLGVGAMATPHGSVATLIAGDLAGASGYSRVLAVAAACSVLVAAVVLALVGGK